MSGANCSRHGPYYPAYPGCPECIEQGRAHWQDKLEDRIAALEQGLEELCRRVLSESELRSQIGSTPSTGGEPCL